jgi:hypothetical protein
MKHALFTLILLLGTTNFVIAGDYEDGQAAFDRVDYATAAAKFTKAAEAGNTDAQLMLAFRYLHGEGVPKDTGKMMFWLTKAAEAGNAEAQRHLGFSYKAGTGIPQDFKKAVHWFPKAAEAGDAKGQWMLGQMYEYGHGVTQDPAQAEHWYTKPLKQGMRLRVSRLT